MTSTFNNKQANVKTDIVLAKGMEDIRGHQLDVRHYCQTNECLYVSPSVRFSIHPAVRLSFCLYIYHQVISNNVCSRQELKSVFETDSCLKCRFLLFLQLSLFYLTTWLDKNEDHVDEDNDVERICKSIAIYEIMQTKSQQKHNQMKSR